MFGRKQGFLARGDGDRCLLLLWGKMSRIREMKRTNREIDVAKKDAWKFFKKGLFFTDAVSLTPPPPHNSFSEPTRIALQTRIPKATSLPFPSHPHNPSPTSANLSVRLKSPQSLAQGSTKKPACNRELGSHRFRCVKQLVFWVHETSQAGLEPRSFQFFSWKLQLIYLGPTVRNLILAEINQVVSPNAKNLPGCPRCQNLRSWL